MKTTKTMKAIVYYSLDSYSETIDLEDFSFENKKFEDMTEEEQHEIIDSLKENKIYSIKVDIKTIE